MLWDTLFALLLIGVLRYGDYITYECPQEGYTCPKICDVDHKHLPRKECQDAKSRKERVPLYRERQEGCQEGCQEDWEENNTQEEVLIRIYKDAKTKQESKPDSTTVQSIE